MAYTQPITSYSDTTPQRRIITDVISIIDPADTPLITALGGLDGASGKFRFVNGMGTKVEWLEDTLAGLATTLSASIASNATAIVLNDGSYIQPGHLLQISTATATQAGADEVVWVSSVSSNSVTATRGISGTQTTCPASAIVSVVGMARIEGADSNSVGLTSIGTNSNYTEIYHKELKVSRTIQQVSQYGIADELAYQEAKAVPELMRLVERNALRVGLGISTTNSAWNGNATQGRVMAGLPKYITTNTVSGANFSTPTNVQGIVESAVQLAYAAGGDGPWYMFLSPTNMRRVKNVYDNSSYVMVTRGENQIGMKIQSILTPFGEVNLVLDRWATDGDIYLVDPKHAGFVTLQPFATEELAKTGDFIREEVIGEFTMAVRQNAAHAKIATVS